MTTSDTKTCGKCKVALPLNCFFKNHRAPSGLAYKCKPCANAEVKLWRENNPEKVQGYRRNYYAANTELVKARARQHHRENPEMSRNRQLKKYGLTVADYDAMLEAQGGGCAVCRSTDCRTPKRVRLHVDHCHTTGRVRGLLYSPCNTALGCLKDDSKLARRMATYIEVYR